MFDIVNPAPLTPVWLHRVAQEGSKGGWEAQRNKPPAPGLFLRVATFDNAPSSSFLIAGYHCAASASSLDENLWTIPRRHQESKGENCGRTHVLAQTIEN